MWKIQLDTYEREIARYGDGRAIELAEEIFHLDSEAAAEILTGLGADPILRWQLTLCGMDRMLSDLGFDLAAKYALANRARRTFADEFRTDAALRHQLGKRFLVERAGLEALLRPDAEAPPPVQGALAVLARRTRSLSGPAAELRTMAQRGTLSVSFDDIGWSVYDSQLARRRGAVAQEAVTATQR